MVGGNVESHPSPHVVAGDCPYRLGSCETTAVAQAHPHRPTQPWLGCLRRCEVSWVMMFVVGVVVADDGVAGAAAEVIAMATLSVQEQAALRASGVVALAALAASAVVAAVAAVTVAVVVAAVARRVAAVAAEWLVYLGVRPIATLPEVLGHPLEEPGRFFREPCGLQSRPRLLGFVGPSSRSVLAVGDLGCTPQFPWPLPLWLVWMPTSRILVSFSPSVGKRHSQGDGWSVPHVHKGHRFEKWRRMLFVRPLGEVVLVDDSPSQQRMPWQELPMDSRMILVNLGQEGLLAV